MTIALLSCFQNSVRKGYLPRYFKQIAELSGYLAARDDRLRVVCSEGDSTDDTREALRTYAKAARGLVPIQIVDGETGSKKEWGSTTSTGRFAQFAYASNQALEAVRVDDDVVIIVESDLVWTPQTLAALATRVMSGFPNLIVAPIPLARVGTDGWRLYDTWAFRKPGAKAFSLPSRGPWSWDADDRFTEMDSVGSCLAMPSHVARAFRMTDTEAVVGFCRQARAAGVTIAADGTLTVVHP